MATPSQATAALESNRHGRAALGIAAAAIRRGYDVIGTIRPETALGGLLQAGGVFGGLGDSDVRQQATDMLDRANAYAQGLYGMIPDTDDPIDDAMRSRVGVALDTALSDLKVVETVSSALVETFTSDLEDLVNAIASATQASVAWVATQAKQIVASVVPTWVWWVAGGAAVAGLGIYAWRLGGAGVVPL